MSDMAKLVLVVVTAVALGIALARMANSQSLERPGIEVAQGLEPLEPLPPSSGFSIRPDGGVSSWSDGSGYSIGPGSTSSWSPNGGYSSGADGSFSTWQGPQLPIILPDGQVILVPGVGQ